VATVQANVEAALSFVADAPIDVVCAGRTDTGVHGTSQIIHFDSPNPRPDRAWVLGSNTQLPPQIRVLWSVAVSEDFHARFSATARRYRYVIDNSPVQSAVLSQGLTHQRVPLDAAAMHRSAQSLLGEQDFSSFRGAGCQSNTPFRNVHNVRVVRQGSIVVVEIEANAFLLHMVRNIVGSLMEIGMGRKNEAWIADLLAAKDRRLAAATAAPNGLYLVDVTYPDFPELPKLPLGPFFTAFLDD
jgi:tRNA pseudouridine38-40 synthase